MRPIEVTRWKSSLALSVLAFSISATAWAQPFAYVSNPSTDRSVTVIDCSTNTVVTTIPTGAGTDPYWVNISANGKTVAVSLHNATGVALIDGTTNTLLGVVGGVGGEPEAVAVNSTGTTVYVADEGDTGLFVIDVATMMVTRTITLLPAAGPTCTEPESMLISPDDRFLYISCPGGVTDNYVRVEISTGIITEIAPNTGDAHGLALTQDGTRLYYSDGTDVFEYNTVTGMLTGTTFLGCDMYGGAVSPDGSTLYCIEEFGNNSAKVYSTATGALLRAVNLRPSGTSTARAVAVCPTNNRAYVPVDNIPLVQIIDPNTLTTLPAGIVAGNNPRGIAIGPARGSAAPTLGPWAAVVLAALLFYSGLLVVRRRRSV